MTNMSQFTDNIDEISFVESSSIYDDTDISTNVSICEKETDPVDPLFNQHIPLWGRQGLHSRQNTVFKQSQPLRRSQGLHSSKK